MARPTSWTWQERRLEGGKRNVLNVARATFQTWQERRCKRRNRDVANVARPTCQTSQDRCFKRGKTDISIVARETFQTSQERRCKRRKRDVNRYHLRRGCYGSDTPKCRNKGDIYVVGKVTSCETTFKGVRCLSFSQQYKVAIASNAPSEFDPNVLVSGIKCLHFTLT